MLKIKDSIRVWLCPTDTLYGLSARVGDEAAIERIREIKGGREGMHFITLIADIEQLESLGVSISDRQRDFLQRVWPGPVSVIINGESYRLPEYPELRDFIREVGPIISTSANRHGEAPVTTVAQAKEIFGSEVDEYLDAGVLAGEASTLVEIIR